SLRLGPPGPALKSEGLAMWAAELGRETSLDQWAVLVSLFAELPLPALVNDSYFRDPEHVDPCYLIAGSFTGYLIRRYGWSAYLQFYRPAGPSNCPLAFEQAFRVTLTAAEADWRRGLPPKERIHVPSLFPQPDPKQIAWLQDLLKQRLNDLQQG